MRFLHYREYILVGYDDLTPEEFYAYALKTFPMMTWDEFCLCATPLIEREVAGCSLH
jgi:hypothetical protein